MFRHILFLVPQLPFPPEQGTALRNYNLLRQAARISQVSLLAFAPPGTAVPTELASLCQHARLVPLPPKRTIRQRLVTVVASRKADMAVRLASPAFNQALGEMIALTSCDAIQVEGIELALPVLSVASTRKLPVIYDAHNAEWLLQRRAAQTDWRQPKRWLTAAYSSVQWRRLRNLERSICLQARVVLACSEKDAQALTQLDRHILPQVLPNGVDTSLCNASMPAANLEHPALVFTGKMDYRPNVDAVTWFVQNVWPRVKDKVPGAHCYLIGKDPSGPVKGLAQVNGIEVTGYVPSVHPYLSAADCYIIPLRVGGGTRLKLLEALACGLPIVSTSLGAEGVDVHHEEQLLLADTAEAFAQAVLQLLQDKELARILGARARELAIANYDWEVLAPRLRKAYQLASQVS